MSRASTVDSSILNETIEKVSETPNLLVRWWNTIDWTAIISDVVARGIYLVLLLIFFYFLNRLAKSMLHRTFIRKNRRTFLSTNRAETIYKILENTLGYIMAFFVIYSVLSILGIPVSTLLAGAGIAGVAIGLGAQSFISDIVNGFFIILENQLDVGDTVKIGDISGSVVSIGLRSTQIKSFDGAHHYIPNHTIDLISNSSRNDMRALIDLTLYPDSDFSIVAEVVDQVNERLVAQHPEIVKGPNIMGLTNKGNGLVSYQVVFYTLNGEQFKIQNLFLREYLSALQSAGVDLPVMPSLQQ